ncbi:glutamate receptor ionotropic, delta-1-like [Procambarus clarkii]|uniref:glutamate receptor ionotropic, delta-1-like n=1 Tax=Procambarus clarkii TaxID=6728 RepID=UPI003743480F
MTATSTVPSEIASSSASIPATNHPVSSNIPSLPVAAAGDILQEVIPKSVTVKEFAIPETDPRQWNINDTDTIDYCIRSGPSSCQNHDGNPPNSRRVYKAGVEDMKLRFSYLEQKVPAAWAMAVDDEFSRSGLDSAESDSDVESEVIETKTAPEDEFECERQQLRQVSWCVTVVVVSDDLAFLAAFAQWSLKGRLVGPATRLLAVTNASLVNNPDLSRTYSMMNAMMLVVEDFQNHLRCGVYLHVPYSPRGAKALKVAFWTPHQGLALTSSLPLFPDKFSKLSNGPTLIVVTETYPTHEIVLVDDSKSPGGKRLEFFSPIANVLQLLANVTNFTYLYMRPPDGLWGSQQNDGSWSGMVGMVSREEVDVGLGPFSVSASRAEVVDFTWPISVYYGKILGGRGRLVVDPWGFVLPLTPLVWAAILATLLVLPLTVSLLSSCVSVRTPGECIEDTFRFITIFLHQDIWVRRKWWWERVVMLVWMMVTLVLTQSYAGNLMALLAVRHIPQPIQSLLDILHDQSATIIVEAGSTKALYFLIINDSSTRDP